jgi:hypothetical protein
VCYQKRESTWGGEEATIFCVEMCECAEPFVRNTQLNFSRVKKLQIVVNLVF